MQTLQQPPAVEQQRQPMCYVGVGRRAVAILLDTLILGALGTPFGIASSPRTWSLPLGWLFSVGVVFAYYVVLEATLGATLGKLVMGIRVVKLDGSPIRWQEAIIRNLVRAVDAMFVYLVAALVVWNSSLDQRLGDMAANTVVIRVRPMTFPGPSGQPGRRE